MTKSVVISPVDSKSGGLVPSPIQIKSTLCHSNDTMRTKHPLSNEQISLLQSITITSPPIQDSTRMQHHCFRRRRRKENEQLSVKFVDECQNDICHYEQAPGPFYNQDVWYTADEFHSMSNDIDHIVRSRMRHVAGQRRSLIRYILELQSCGKKHHELVKDSTSYPSCCGATTAVPSCRSTTPDGCSTFHNESCPEYLANAYYQCSKYARLDAITRATHTAEEVRNLREQEEGRRVVAASVIEDVLDIMMLDTDSFRSCRPSRKDTTLQRPSRTRSPPP